jgi:hypothetical protein
MSSNEITIKFNTSDNPWIESYETITFSKEKLMPIVKAISSACEGKTHYENSYQYDRDVDNAIKSCNITVVNRRPLYMAISKILTQEISKRDMKNWHDSCIAAKRTLECKIAYMTPGFIEAKRYNEMYGD